MYKSNSQAVASLDTWLEAWSLYAGALASQFPSLAPDLFAYQGFISRKSRKFQPHAWLSYDTRFRQRLALNPSMAWSTPDPELVASYMSSGATKRRVTCYLCGYADHLAPDCLKSFTSSHSFRQPPQLPGAGPASLPYPASGPHQPLPGAPPITNPPIKPSDICHNYNRRTCFRTFCKRHTSAYPARAPIPSESALGSLALDVPIHVHTICTPLQPLLFARYLQAHPDSAFTSNLIYSLLHGFRIGYSGPHVASTASNLTSAFQHPEVIDEALHMERIENCIAGPYTQPPFPNLICSGLGTVPKSNGSWRLIYHLSAPPGTSINDFIDPTEYSLQYHTIDYGTPNPPKLALPVT